MGAWDELRMLFELNSPQIWCYAVVTFLGFPLCVSQSESEALPRALLQLLCMVGPQNEVRVYSGDPACAFRHKC